MYTLYCLLLQHKSQVEVLQNLPSYKKYENFDNVDIANEKSSHCNDLGSTDEGDKKLCKKIVQNLSQLSALKDDENLKNSCYYFQHWFFDNIAKKYYNGNERGNNYPVAGKLFNIVSTITSVLPKMEPCKCYESGSPDVWKEEKYFHDYFENHKDIQCKNSDKQRCEKYVQFVTYIKSLFPPKEDKCCDEEELWDEGYCHHYFKCESTYNPKDLLTKLQKELELAEKRTEAPREGGARAVEAGKALGSGGEEREKKTHEDEVSAEATGKESKEKLVAGEVPKEKGADSPAQSAPEKNVAVKSTVPESVGLKPGGLESREEKAKPAKPVAAKPATAMPTPPELAPVKPAPAKPVAAKVTPEEPVQKVPEPKVSVPPEPERKVSPPEVPEQEVVETVDTLEHEETMSPRQMESAEQSVHEVSSYTTELANNVVPLTIADSTNTLGTTHEELDSNFFRNVIMAIAVLGTIFFLFYYNRVIAHHTL
ncbi:variable surface protein Vir12, putative [Plasmodium vivax]|uniref:Variable surface protein Vir12, putative n=1 Tax=Plasmodium vivax (strain Salvador I) TaxID=126793 RepID=A5KCU5_PLAVS|nr:variable surface protein Vir12, putative [Plasmodium vivax]EDL42826.1 variable surface protein Vir12, putative [Plasmodium vivax]|eukprot:XP_001608558.1 variable surface protein Vir12 [Plasmodium vivax Sal-1]